MKARRHSSAPRENEKGKKAEKNAILRCADCGWGGGCAASGFAGVASAIDAAEAGAGAAEVVKGAVVLSTPGTEAWWRAAVGEAVYAMREVQYVRETVNWTVLLKKGLGGLQLLQRLDPPLPSPVEPKAEPSARL